VPRWASPPFRALGRAVLSALRWRIQGDWPDLPKCVIIVAPHTSNWDFVIGMATVLAIGFRVHYIAKHTLFRGVFGRLLRFSGGIPIDRRAAGGVSERSIESFAASPQLLLCITPEGTRAKTERWKSGFHRIARGAGVPILPVAFDYRERVVRLHPLFQPSGDYERDLLRLQSLFHAGMARHPENY
jgi:1-acyl-sn-glycerol-3-phosphate acyltransferase